jgi:hypothetical protein
MLVVTLPITNGCADISAPTFDGIHTRNCCVLQKVNPDVYYAMGNAKEKFRAKENHNPNNAESSASASLIKKPEQPTFAKKAKVCTDVTEEMKACIEELTTTGMKRSTLPKEIYHKVRAEMDMKYQETGGWMGIEYKIALALVQNSRRLQNFGDPISMIENTPEYNSMQDSDLPFLQASLNFANPKRGKDRIRIMIFANPALLGMLKIPALDVFVDATFNCCPNSFYQCLIFMIYDHATSSYVPILYALMTSKCKEAYWQVSIRLWYCPRGKSKFASTAQIMRLL